MKNNGYVPRHAGETPAAHAKSAHRRAQVDLHRALALLEVEADRGDLTAIRLHLALSTPERLRMLAASA